MLDGDRRGRARPGAGRQERQTSSRRRRLDRARARASRRAVPRRARRRPAACSAAPRGTSPAQSRIERGGARPARHRRGRPVLARHRRSAASVAAQRLLLLGDPQQLPQVSQGTHPEPVDESALGWLIGRPRHAARRARATSSATSYRMHPALCAQGLDAVLRRPAAPPPTARAERVAGRRRRPGCDGRTARRTIGNRTESAGGGRRGRRAGRSAARHAVDATRTSRERRARSTERRLPRRRAVQRPGRR